MRWSIVPITIVLVIMSAGCAIHRIAGVASPPPIPQMEQVLRHHPGHLPTLKALAAIDQHLGLMNMRLASGYGDLSAPGEGARLRELATGQLRRADALLREYLRLVPHDYATAGLRARTNIRLVTVDAALHRTGSVLADWRNIIALRPNMPEYYLFYGYAARLAGRPLLALQQFHRFLTLAPHSAAAVDVRVAVEQLRSRVVRANVVSDGRVGRRRSSSHE